MFGCGSSFGVGATRGSMSSWWNDVIKVTTGEKGKWFWADLIRTVGDEERTNFWRDPWVGSEPLCVRFLRLFHLCSRSEGSIMSKWKWNGGSWEWEWDWRRPLFDRELPLFNNMLELINRYPLQHGITDSWKWRLNPKGIYSTKTVDSTLHHRPDGGHSIMDRGFKHIWNKFIPTKVSATTWRILLGRLSTKDNLKRRNTLSEEDDLLCVFCINCPETVNHVLFECGLAHRVWTECCKWLGIPMSNHNNPLPHLLSHGDSLSGKYGCLYATTFWSCVVWMLWTWRNARIFKGEAIVLDIIVEDIKSRLWSWFSVKSNTVCNFSYSDWLVKPREILGC